MKAEFACRLADLCVVAPSAFAVQYLTVDQASARFFPQTFACRAG